MTLLLVAIAGVFGVGLVISLRRRAYALSVFTVVFFLYELSGPAIYTLLDEDFLTALTLFAARASGLELYLVGIGAAYAATLVTFLAHQGLSQHRTPLNRGDDQQLHPMFVMMTAFLLLCGVISIFTDAAAIRIQDYAGAEDPASPFFSYGTLLFVPVSVYAMYAFWSRRMLLLAIVVIFAFPICEQIFLTARRQYFAPTLLAAMLLILYLSKGRRKALYIASIAALGLVFLGLQYLVRDRFYGADTSGASAFEVALAPQLGEFVAISSTTLYGWDMFVVGDQAPTWGVHLGFHLLQAFPFVKLGAIFFPQYQDHLFSLYRELAPFGGLSMLADSYLSFGVLGIAGFGLASGVAVSIWHNQLKLNFGSARLRFTRLSIYQLSLMCIVILKYRSGFGDVIVAAASFSILYLFFALLGKLFVMIRPRTAPVLRFRLD